MKILALEFSSPKRAVAILDMGDDASRILAEIVDSDFRGKPGVLLLQQALAMAGISPAGIDRIAVGLGPGSYTGIRSALAIAQGWHLGGHTPVVGISTVEILAWQCAEAKLGQRVEIIIDAQRKELYSAVYEVSSATPKNIRELTILPAAALTAQPGTIIAGPEASRFVPDAREVFPSAVLLAKLAASHPPAPPESLEPIYLRPVSFVKAPPPRFIA